MCGISVLITKELNKTNLKSFEMFFREQEHRGGDSAGIFYQSPKNNGLFFDLNKSIKKPFKQFKQDIYQKKLFGQPIMILGHTRATATGSNSDYHPATDYEGEGVMIHNGVVSDDYGYYYHLNDTYHLINLLKYEGITKKDLKALKYRIYTSGSTIFYYDQKYGYLDFLKVGYTPLLGWNNKKDYYYCSTTISKLFKPVDKGFNRININNLFKKDKIKVEKNPIEYIMSYEDLYKDSYYEVVNPKKDGDIWEYKNDRECSLLEGYGCTGCLECSNRNNIYYYD